MNVISSGGKETKALENMAILKETTKEEILRKSMLHLASQRMKWKRLRPKTCETERADYCEN
jgi:hypothetical protein